jgi:quercetin dioxygenase-like cupin family protein
MTTLTRRDGSTQIAAHGPVACMYPEDVGQIVVHGSKREFFKDVAATYEHSAVNSMKVLLATDDFVMFEAFRAKGSIDVAHIHTDHYATVFLKKGRIRMRIGRDTFVMEEGDSCYHARGMLHQHEALEDCIRIETKVYPEGSAVENWNKLIGAA